MTAKFNSDLVGFSEPGPDIIPIAGDDATDLTTPVRALRAETAGTIKVHMFGVGGVTVARTLNFKAGETRIGMFVRVWLTGTTATGIEGHV